MPRKPIDYSNTIIYKLCCNDPTIKDIYVGHTTNWTKRKGHHKGSCNNKNDKCYNYYVYQFIRNHGGWTNWSMIELEKICCVDELEACKHERRYFDLLGATLNTNTPSRTNQEWHTNYRENNVEKELERHKKYREENKEQIREQSKKYREENKEQIREQSKKYRENNVEKIKDGHKKYRENNREKLQERDKKYRENNVEKEQERKKKYRLLQKQIKLETERLFDIDI